VIITFGQFNTLYEAIREKQDAFEDDILDWDEREGSAQAKVNQFIKGDKPRPEVEAPPVLKAILEKLGLISKSVSKMLAKPPLDQEKEVSKKSANPLFLLGAEGGI
jgi:hypothetical protein